MIARLTGLVVTVEDGRCVIDVNGVGYLVHASTRTLAALPGPPAQARLWVETQVREDAIVLNGFADIAERDWFRLLVTVQGVGTRVALGILSALSPNELAVAIAGGDRAALSNAPGVGAKLAARLLTELRDRASTLAMPQSGASTAALAPGVQAADALSALLNLGYRRPEALAALDRARADGAVGLDGLIRAALRELVR